MPDRVCRFACHKPGVPAGSVFIDDSGESSVPNVSSRLVPWDLSHRVVDFNDSARHLLSGFEVRVARPLSPVRAVARAYGPTYHEEDQPTRRARGRAQPPSGPLRCGRHLGH